MESNNSEFNEAFAEYFDRYFAKMVSDLGYSLSMFREDLEISYTALNNLKKGM